MFSPGPINAGFESALQLCQHIAFLSLETLTLNTVEMKYCCTGLLSAELRLCPEIDRNVPFGPTDLTHESHPQEGIR